MARRTNSPLHTTILLLLLGGAGYMAYEYLYVRKILASEGGPARFAAEDRDQIRATILARFDHHVCFLELGQLVYRAKDDQWRIDLTVADGCSDAAAQLCQDVADMLADEFRVSVSVWAFDDAGREIAHRLP
jgi:hypothetical protein